MISDFSAAVKKSNTKCRTAKIAEQVRGGRGTYVHDMSGLIRQKCKKCLACGSEACRQKDCLFVGAESERTDLKSEGRRSPKKQSNMETGGSQPGVDPGRAEESLEPSCGWCLRRPMLLHPSPRMSLFEPLSRTQMTRELTSRLDLDLLRLWTVGYCEGTLQGITFHLCFRTQKMACAYNISQQPANTTRRTLPPPAQDASAPLKGAAQFKRQLQTPD